MKPIEGKTRDDLVILPSFLSPYKHSPAIWRGASARHSSFFNPSGVFFWIIAWHTKGITSPHVTLSSWTSAPPNSSSLACWYLWEAITWAWGGSKKWSHFNLIIYIENRFALIPSSLLKHHWSVRMLAISIYLYHIWHCCHQESFEVLQWRNLVSKKGTPGNDEHVDHLHDKTEIYHNTKENKWKNLIEMTSTEIHIACVVIHVFIISIYPTKYNILPLLSYMHSNIHYRTCEDISNRKNTYFHCEPTHSDIYIQDILHKRYKIIINKNKSIIVN